jgi:phenylacetate-CoA ligase
VDISGTLIRNAVIPLWMVRDGSFPALGLARQFEALDSMPPEKLRQQQSVRLQRLLEHSIAHVPYYRDLLSQRGIKPAGLTQEAWLAIPLLTKRDVRDNGQKLVSTNFAADELFKDSTGGSTGTPMTFYRTRACLHQRRAQDLFFDRWFGCRLGDKVALFVSASHHADSGSSWKARLRSSTYERMLRFDPSRTTDAEMAEFLPAYLEFNAPVIKCFPNSLAIFAEYTTKKGVRLPAVRTVFCTGESVYAHQREQFAQTFNAKVVERYGTKECGIIASECPAGRGMHVFSEGVLLEVLDPNGQPCKPGEIGRVVVTDLFNEGMPLIRYEIGDMAEVADESAPCPCGSRLPRIARIIGRDRDIVIDGEGVRRPGYLFVDILGKADLDAQIQVMQLEDGRIEVRVAQLRSPPERLTKVQELFQKLMGPKLGVSIRYVDEISRDPSGKYPYVVSKYRPQNA